MAHYQDLPVFADIYALTHKVFLYTQDYPREYKFTLGQDMKRDCLVLLRSIYRINKSTDKVAHLEAFLDEFELLKLEIRLSGDLKLLPSKKHGELILLTDSIGKQITGWRNASLRATTHQRRKSMNAQPATGYIEFHELLEAYFRCRKNKRRTHNALAFELDYEANLVTLWNEINDGTYRPGKSIAFIVNKPVKREIFAADFKDRIVHHLIISKLNPLFEQSFIFDSYACRTGKGTLFGIKRLERFIRRASANYSRDAYVLKLDIRGFFMHINVEILYAKLMEFIHSRYVGADKGLLMTLTKVVLFNNPSQNCVIKGAKSGWDGLPPDKSLFYSPVNCGLPIGNLSSQVFANFYLNVFDHLIKKECGIKFYGRYVDDFVLVHQDGQYLRSLIPRIRSYLLHELGLTLHPNKIYLQRYEKGVAYLGTLIKPGRVYVGRRIKANFYRSIQQHNHLLAEFGQSKPDILARQSFQSSMNSYLGIMGHHNTYRLRKSMVSKKVQGWWRFAYVNGGVTKFVLKP